MIAAALVLGAMALFFEPAWIWAVHRMEERASRKDSGHD